MTEQGFKLKEPICQNIMNEICTNDRPITKEEVRQLTRNLKQGKVPWLDNLCGEYLKNAKADTTQFLTLLFNNI